MHVKHARFLIYPILTAKFNIKSFMNLTPLPIFTLFWWHCCENRIKLPPKMDVYISDKLKVYQTLKWTRLVLGIVRHISDRCIPMSRSNGEHIDSYIIQIQNSIHYSLRDYEYFKLFKILCCIVLN